jgi:hypothetical protein
MDFTTVKLMIGCPAKPAHVAVAHEQAKIATLNLMRRHNIPVYTLPVSDCAWIGHARAALTAKFMISGATHLLMIDNDVSWKAEDVLRMLTHDVPFVGAIQADRKRGTFFVGRRRGGEDDEWIGGKYDEVTQLLACERLSAAFNLIRRDCIERLMEAHPHLQAHKSAKWFMKNDVAAQPYFYGFWEQRIVDGDWPGEDHAFCDRMIDAGIPVFVDPWIELGHWVEIERYGCLGDEMKLRDGSTLPNPRHEGSSAA